MNKTLPQREVLLWPAHFLGGETESLAQVMQLGSGGDSPCSPSLPRGLLVGSCLPFFFSTNCPLPRPPLYPATPPFPPFVPFLIASKDTARNPSCVALLQGAGIAARISQAETPQAFGLGREPEGLHATPASVASVSLPPSPRARLPRHRLIPPHLSGKSLASTMSAIGAEEHTMSPSRITSCSLGLHKELKSLLLGDRHMPTLEGGKMQPSFLPRASGARRAG